MYKEGGVFSIKSSTTLKTVETKFKVIFSNQPSNFNWLHTNVHILILRTLFSIFFKQSTDDFQLGEEFDETTPDGREVTTVGTMEVLISLHTFDFHGGLNIPVYI